MGCHSVRVRESWEAKLSAVMHLHLGHYDVGHGSWERPVRQGQDQVMRHSLPHPSEGISQDPRVAGLGSLSAQFIIDWNT